MRVKTYPILFAALVAITVSGFSQTPIHCAITAKDATPSFLPANVVNLGDSELRFGSTTNASVWEGARIDDQNPSLSSDGLSLFYVSTEPSGLGQHDIWFITRSNLSAAWSSPASLGPIVNSEFDEGDAKLSYDGLTLYFSSNRPGGSGGYDIWTTTRASTSQPFTAPVNLGPNVNSKSDDGTTAVSADNRTLIFASFRSGGIGGLSDLWICTRTNAQTEWEPANPMDAPINSENFEISPALSPDGRTLFFMSDREATGPGTIWVSRRPDTDSPFGPASRIVPISDSFPLGTDFPSISPDGTKLYFNTYLEPYPDWSALKQIDITPVPQLKAGEKKSRGAFQFELIGRDGAIYEIQASADGKAWLAWVRTNTTSSVMISDTELVLKNRRFYRAVTQ